MPGNGAVVAAVFGQANGPLLPRGLPVTVRPEIPVDALNIAAALVIPAAGMVDGPGRILSADRLNRLQGVKLPPALVKGHPHRQADGIIQKLHQLSQLLHIVRPSPGIAAGKIAVVIVLDPQPEIGKT